MARCLFRRWGVFQVRESGAGVYGCPRQTLHRPIDVAGSPQMCCNAQRIAKVAPLPKRAGRETCERCCLLGLESCSKDVPAFLPFVVDAKRSMHKNDTDTQGVKGVYCRVLASFDHLEIFSF
jgi:hypothetical protein